MLFSCGFSSFKNSMGSKKFEQHRPLSAARHLVMLAAPACRRIFAVVAVCLLAGCANCVLESHPAVPNDQSGTSLLMAHRSLRSIRPTCNATFEPTCSLYPYVRYWNKELSGDDCYESPLRPVQRDSAPWAERKYVVFRPDAGGWNNVRMSAETAIILAHATGRTLVMPPLFRMYQAHAKDEEGVSASTMLFDMNKVSEALSVVSMDDFVKNVVKKGRLNMTYSKHLNSLGGRTNLWNYLSTVCKHTPAPLEPKSFFLALNITQDEEDKGTIGTFDDLKGSRYQEMLIGNTRTMVPYNLAMHDERVLYLAGEGEDRMLVHFYAYLHWADPHVEQIYLRIARDRLRYRDDIFCGAGRVVKLVHHDASLLPPHLPVQSAELGHSLTLGGDTNRDATYFAFHIRRNDFQVYYKNQEISGETIWANTKHLLNSSISTLIYIATDEKNKSFFAPFMQPPYTVKFLYDYEYVLQDANTAAHSTAVSMNRIGMMEQVICANAHTFVGTFWSTFTGYITRMRGYYRDGRYARTYYSSAGNLYDLQQRKSLEGTLWGREFEKAHKNINY